MSLTASAISLSGSWTQTKTNGAFGISTQGPDSLSYQAAPSIVTYSELFLNSYTIAAAGTQVLDFRSFTNTLGTSVTATKIIAILLKATATVTGAKMKIEPDATDGLTWFFGGTGPYIELEVGTDGACLAISEGVAQTVDATHKELLVTNSGTQSLTLYVYGLVGNT